KFVKVYFSPWYPGVLKNMVDLHWWYSIGSFLKDVDAQ
ncbi:hypothetical protein A2U01_0094696, partial [Trifolium medium]|nr:hypothetical protein [Trifolium medium]